MTQHLNRYEGPLGWAQRMVWAPDTVGTAALVDLWFMHLPKQAFGNAWENYMLGVCHLRKEKGVDDPIINVKGATHELTVLALQPGVQITDPLPWRFLEPPSVAVQFRVGSDNHARQLAADCAHACTIGMLLAESSVYMLSGPYKGKMMIIKEVIDAWEEVVATTSNHYVTGGHHGRLN